MRILDLRGLDLNDVVYTIAYTFMHVVSVREFRKRVSHYLNVSEPVMVMRYGKIVAIVFPQPHKTIGGDVARTISLTEHFRARVRKALRRR